MRSPPAPVDAIPVLRRLLTYRRPESDCGLSLPQEISRTAFTLIELLVVLAVIAVLAALAMGGARRMSESAGIAKSSQQMLQLHRGALLFANENSGRLPSTDAVDPTTRQILRWWDAIYPYLYDAPLGPAGLFGPDWTYATHLKGTVYHCPLKDRSDEGTPVRSYAWNNRLKVTGSPARPLSLLSVKQPSKTMMFVTSKLGSGIDYPSGTFNRVISTRAGGKALVVFVDGHLEKRSKDEIPLGSSDPFWIP